MPYYLYKYTGNKEIILENSEMIMRYLKYACSKRKDDGLAEYGLGDWCDPFEKENKGILAPLVVVSSVAIYDMANKAAFLFKKAGLESDFAENLASEMRECIRKSLIDFDTMTVKGDCQTSQTICIYAGIFNEDEIDKANKKLVEIIHRDGDLIACGIYGKRFMFNVLSDMGESELAYKMITSKHRVGYGYWIENGATSLWERFKLIDDIKADNSKNHHFNGHISSWFIQELAGLKPNPNADDISCFEISPSFIPQLSDAKAHYESKFGEVSVSWARENERIILLVNAPKGTHGDIRLKNGCVFSDGASSKSWDEANGCDMKLEVL